MTVHSWRYIYATKLYLKGVSPDAIKDILGVDKRTLKHYIKATQERKKRALFTHPEKEERYQKTKLRQTPSVDRSRSPNLLKL